MSTLITIGIKLDPYTFKVSLKMLLDRITSQAKIHSVRLKEGYEYSEHTYLSAHHDKIYENSLIPLDKTNAAVEFRLELLGEMGNNFFVDLHHYGKDFHRGSRYLEDSPISIKINQSQFQQPNAHFSQVEKGSGLNQNNSAINSQLVVTHLDWLFIDLVCGYPVSDYQGVTDAAMYLERGWPSPFACSMIYHKNVDEYLWDYIRIWAEYNFGPFNHGKLKNNLIFSKNEIEKLSEIEFGHPIKDNMLLYTQFYDEKIDFYLPFLRQLNSQKVLKLLNMPISSIREAIVNTASNDTNSDFFEFKDSGLAVITAPLYGLGLTYKDAFNILMPLT